MAGGTAFEADLADAEASLSRLVGRLRVLSPKSWQTYRAPVRLALSRLVALNADLEGRTLAAPDVADHVLADAIAVVGGDVLMLLSRAAAADSLVEVQAVLDQALAETR